MTKVAIVILNWNGEKMLRQFLPSVLAHSNSEGVKLIIADNHSTDNSKALIHEEYPDIHWIQLSKNFGFAGGYNKALEQVEAEYYVLLNSDVEVSPDWIQPLIQAFEQDHKIAAAMPKLISYTDKEFFEYAGAAGGFIDYLGFPFCRGRIFSSIEKDLEQYNDACDIFWASGAALFVRAKNFHEVGGFDERFFAHMEEIDLCWRLQNAGYKIHYQPQSTVYHLGGGTLPNESPQKLYLNFRNNLFLLYKNLEDSQLQSILFKRKLFDGLAAIQYLLQFKFAQFKAVWKAHMDFYRQLPELKNYRKHHPVPHLKLPIYSKSIVKDFFLLGKKKFSDLEF